MESQGGVKFRTGGTSGEMGFLIGRWAELGEDTLQLDVYVCPQCRRVELFYPERSEAHLPDQNTDTPRSFLKVCVKCRKKIPIASEECPFCGARQER
jgi:rubrerythrin